jgi:hypothetical protein
MAMNIPTTFKVKFSQTGEIRRFNACKSYDELQNKLITFWGKHSYVLSYLDEDEDRITVSSNEDFEEALSVVRHLGEKVLKFDAQASTACLAFNASSSMLPQQALLQSIRIGTNLKKTIPLKKKTLQPNVERYPLLSRYRSMLRAKVPWGAVKQRMKVDGYTLPPKYDRMLTAQVPWDAVMQQMDLDGVHSIVKCLQAKPVIPEVHRCTIKSGSTAYDQELPQVYNNMLCYGVPWNAVVSRMKRDGYETNKLNQQEPKLRQPAESCRPKLLLSIQNGKTLRNTQPQPRSVPRLSRVDRNELRSTMSSLSSPAPLQSTKNMSSENPLLNSITKGKRLRPTERSSRCVNTHPRQNLCNAIKAGTQLRSTPPPQPRPLVDTSFPMTCLLTARLPSPSKRVSFSTAPFVIPEQDARPRSRSDPLSVSHPPVEIVEITPPTASPVISMSSEMVQDETLDPEVIEAPLHPMQNQLDQLEMMGFTDRAQSLSLLASHQGMVELVVNSLLAINM